MSYTPIYDKLCQERRIYPTLRDLVRFGGPVEEIHSPIDRTWDEEYWWTRRRRRKNGGLV